VPRAVERFQVYPRQTRGGVEPDAVAEQHRHTLPFPVLVSCIAVLLRTFAGCHPPLR
jgi:hypothetical protein